MLHTALSILPLAFATSCAPLPPQAPAENAPLAKPAAAEKAPLATDPFDDFAPIHFGDKPPFTYGEPYFPGAHYDPAVADPATLLGQAVGSRLATHAEIVAAFEALAATSPRVRLDSYGQTYEGRPLLRAVISSEANLARLDDLRTDLHRLADPRGLSSADGDALTRELPAVAWVGYSIHGDELSGADASMAVAYHLAASTDADVTNLLDNVLVVIDPSLNPDGRERTVSQIRQSFGFVENLDYSSMHRGGWPGGRRNHFLFDMNRDWMSGIAPETRGRWRAVRDLPPQLFIDAHEMDGLDTYLIYPQSQPHNAELTPRLAELQSLFADDNGTAFDAHAWGYYSREWADAWYPAYSDFWGTLNSAVGMLYEQGSTFGQALRRASGEVVTYQESVHGHVTSTLANLDTLASHREEILAGYLAARRANVSDEQPNATRMFVLVPGANASLERDFLKRLVAQGIEVERNTQAFTPTDAVNWNLQSTDREVPANSYLIKVRQPQAPLVRTFLGFDPHMPQVALDKERRSLEAGEGSNMYDLTAWDLGRAFGLDCLWCEVDQVETEAATNLANSATDQEAGSTFQENAVAWAVDGSDDSSIVFVAQALDQGLVVHLAGKPFTAGGHAFPAGSFLLRRHENSALIESEGADAFAQKLAAARDFAHARVFSLPTLRSPDEGPDLGGQTFTELVRPRIAILTGSGVSSGDFGHLWRLIDEELRLPASLLEATRLGRYDLRRFNVLVVPTGAGRSVAKYESTITEWVQGGGTLIAVDSAAVSIARTDLSSLVLRQDALDDLGDYAWALAKKRAARHLSVDADALYGSASEADAGAESETESTEKTGSGDKPHSFLDDAPDKATADAWMRRFSPSGVILAAELEPEHWLTSGRSSEEMPVFHGGSSVLLAPRGVDVPVRFVAADHLRLGGLLWPEARERIADSVWAAVEGNGSGQVISFVDPPAYRGFFKGTARFFANAVVLGPGAGADQPIDL